MPQFSTSFRLGRRGLSALRSHASPCLQTAPRAAMSTNKFWEADKKAGYKSKIKRPTRAMVREGMSMMGEEMGKFKDEMKVKFAADPVLDLQPNDYELVWKFNGEEKVREWVITTDRDHEEGQSHAEFILGRDKTAVFRGAINTEVPKDGVTKRAGYANIRSPKSMKSFKRPEPYDWSVFTHLLMRVRGDGRPYQLGLHMDRYYDVQWNDQYSYTLFTHGGPYWQTAKIPFSKFYLTGKGRVQDKQESIVHQLWQISTLGITIADNSPGPFHLEIDYIGVVFDACHKENFAYEMYETSPAALG